MTVPAHWESASASQPCWKRFEGLYDKVLEQDSPPFIAAQLEQSRITGVLIARRKMVCRVDEHLTLPFPIPIGMEHAFDPGIRPRLPTSTPSHRRHQTPSVAMIREFAKLVSEKALLPVDSIDGWSPLFTVDQTNKTRIIFDLRALNESVLDPSFSMETLTHVPSFIGNSKVMLKLDIRSAFHQFPVSEELSRYLGTSDPSNPDSYYRWSCLPLGLSRSPLIWSSLTTAFCTSWRLAGLRVFVYVDDILIVADSPEELASAAGTVIDDLISSGIRISAKKAHLVPYTSMDFLGLTVDLCKRAFVIPDEKITKIASSALELSSLSPPHPSLQHGVQSLIGRVAYAAVACPWLRFHVAALSRRLSPDSISLPWSADELKELLWWSSEAPTLLGGRAWPWSLTAATRLYARHSTRPIPDFHARCDASDFGIGLRYGSEKLLSEPLPSWLPPSSPSSARELYGICRLIEAGCFPKGSVIRIQCDNTGAVYTAMGSSATPLTAEVARRYFRALLDHEVTVIVEWVPREELDDVDGASRWDENSLAHSTLPPSVRESLCLSAFGTTQPDVLFFSSAHNRWAPKTAFCSRYPEPSSCGDGVESSLWDSCKCGWAYPPFPLVAAVVRRVVSAPRPPRVILILPDTPYLRITLRKWRVIPVTLILPPPSFLHPIPPPIPLAAFLPPPS